MSGIDPVSGSQSPQSPSTIYTPPATSAPAQSMDGNMFLQLLVTQLQNQDPSSPMDTDQMISQTTQLAMMEQLTTMSSTDTQNFSLQMRTNAAALIGQTVSYLDSKGDTVSGVASSVSFAGSIPVVTVGTDQVQLDSILGVTSKTPAPTA